MKNEITIKSKQDIDKMKKSGQIAAMVLDKVKKSIKAGMTTQDIDQMAEKMIIDSGATCSFKGFGGYSNATCISINDEVVHGIPSKRVIKSGDLVGIDVGVYFLGFHADTAITIPIGKISPEDQKLLKITQESLDLAIKNIKPGIHLGDISNLIQQRVEKEGMGVIRDLTGHGIGKNLQEPPSIPNFGSRGTGPILKEGMTLAIEPMVALGDWRVKIKPDGWTVLTLDGTKSAHFEHTFAITKTGAEVLTKI